MQKTMFGILALSAVIAMPARANVQQPSAQQRREIEGKMRDLERQLEELQRQIGDGPRVRTRVFGGPEGVRIGPGGGMFTVTSRPKFGFAYAAEGDSGVKVVSVSPGSPAEKAGLKSGDFITMFNGVRLTGVEEPEGQLRRQAEDLEVGDTVGVEFRRGAEKKSVKMVAADLGPNAYAYAFSTDSTMGGMEMPRMEQLPKVFEMGMLPGRWMDMELVSLNRDLGEYFGTPEGVLVVRAPKDSSLALKSGDVILSIDGRRPATPPQALRILRSYERGESFEVVVLRQKKKVTLTGKVSDRDRGYFYENKTPGSKPAYWGPQDDQQ